MKKYVVIRNYSSGILPSVIFTCDSEDDAKQFATIMSHQDAHIYSVAEVTFSIGG